MILKKITLITQPLTPKKSSTPPETKPDNSKTKIKMIKKPFSTKKSRKNNFYNNSNLKPKNPFNQ
jgi:hypothetical protein